MELELRHFRLVCAVADAGSITRAAAVLGLAQPAVTTQLRRIEQSVGGALFERGRRGSRPTALGELVLARAKVLLSTASGLREDIARLAADSGSAPTRLRLGGATGRVLGGLVHQLTAGHPELEVTTQVSWSVEELAAMAAEGRVDFTVAGVCGDQRPPGGPGMTWRALSVEPVWVLLSARHPLAAREEVDLAELAHEHWAGPPGDGCLADCLVAACSRAGFTPLSIKEADVVSCVELVEKGDVVGVAQPLVRGIPGLVAVAIAGSPLRWRTLIGWHAANPAAAFADRVVAAARAAYRDIVARQPRYTRFLERNPEFGEEPPGAGVVR
ncbi:LysR family transcriptional regulator [Saccharothrix algeriensis]|uniref:DNA-binding transcriptional LysR family regulator n=1 Tax=Saccharothrix algeriensis TaxID=173560 RepID=A0A8T8I356_9PSEU|nr:LysR family transcriptional regulator [Saccharothrix algeriensis]MBM7810265.1 DNA-binding transcriptional LysR family regulator [Saccharothrix algeriensis]QTR04424.1 LysR family transcriptional regulator [Saccharothrix algeriensis]